MGKRLRRLARAAIRRAEEAADPYPYRERYLLLALANELKDEAGETWTSDETMAAKVQMTSTSYYRGRTELIRRGVMVRISGGGQGSRFNRYRLFPTSAASAEESSAANAKVASTSTDPTSATTDKSSSSTDETTAVRADIALSNPEEPAASPMANAAIAEMRQTYPQEWSQAVAEMKRRRCDGAPIRNIDAYAVPRFRELAEERRQGEVNEAARASTQSVIDNCPDCSQDGWIVRDREPGQSPVAKPCNHRRDAPDVVVEPFAYLPQDVEIARDGTRQREVAS